MSIDNQQQPNGDRMDRVERAIEHLVGIQASHDARIERLTAGHAEHAARHQLAEDRLERIELSLDSLVAVQQRHEKELDGLMEIVQRHADETGAKLNSLVQIVDDLVRKRPPQPPAS